MVDVKVHKSVFIDLPVEEVFAYICNVENMLDWSSATISIRKISSGAISAGATMRTTFRFLGRWINVVFEVVEFRPGHCLTFKSISGSPPSLFRYMLEPVDGGTRASHEALVQLSGAGTEQANPVIASAVARQIEYDLQTLKEILEAGLAYS
ncbi:MAG TPA: SRPBCC family protein [Ktedonobacteraceae bacterium]